MLEAGTLRDRVTIERSTGELDELGQVTEEWTRLATIWAGIRPLTANERNANNQQQDVATYEVTVRRPRDIRSTDRLVWGDRKLAISGLLDNFPEKIVLLCSTIEP